MCSGHRIKTSRYDDPVNHTACNDQIHTFQITLSTSKDLEC